MNNGGIVGVGIGLLWVLSQIMSERRAAAAVPAASSAPSSKPAGDFGAQLAAAMAAEDLAGISPRCLAPVGILETGNGTGKAYKASNNAFSIHAIASWSGSCYVTHLGQIFSSYAAAAAAVTDWNTQEILRVYPDLRASVRDMVRELVNNPRYRLAAAQGRAGNVDAFLRALVYGDGRKGWVGDPNTAKAYAYVNAGNSIAGRIA